MYASTTISQPWCPLLKVLGKSLAGLALATSIVGYGFSWLPTFAGSSSTAVASTLSREMVRTIQAPSTDITGHALPLLSDESLSAQSPFSFLEPGIYLYGQSAEANQIDTSYMIFEVEDERVVGAFYMPSSSFDCFQGSIQSNELALSIHDSYAQESYPYSIALVSNTSAIASQNAVIDSTLGIDGFHPIEAVSENDRRMLAVCRADLW